MSTHTLDGAYAFSCPKCKAQAGFSCFRAFKHGGSIDLDNPHKERKQAAIPWKTVPVKPSRGRVAACKARAKLLPRQVKPCPQCKGIHGYLCKAAAMSTLQVSKEGKITKRWTKGGSKPKGRLFCAAMNCGGDVSRCVERKPLAIV